MKNINLTISNAEFKAYGFDKNELDFSEFMQKVNRRIALQALENLGKISEKTGLDKTSMKEIIAEIKSSRNEKKRNNRH